MATKNADQVERTQGQLSQVEGQSEERSFDRPRPTSPKFNIFEANPLTGSNVLVLLNAPMSRRLCDLLDDVDLNATDDAPLYALKKHLRRHYGKMMEAAKNQSPTPQIDAVPEPVGG